MSKQLEDDLARKLYEKLQKACRDHCEICEAADINTKETMDIMFAVLAALLTKGVSGFYTISPDQFGADMAGALATARKGKRASA